jgi:hypothetical protein
VLIGYFRLHPVEQARKSDTEAVLLTQGGRSRPRQRRRTVCDLHFPGVA